MEAERIKNSRARSAKFALARRTNAPRLTASHDQKLVRSQQANPHLIMGFINHGGPAMRLIYLARSSLLDWAQPFIRSKRVLTSVKTFYSLELSIANTKRDIAVLEAEWAYISRPDRVMALSNGLLEMAPIGQDRILPLDAIPMRIDSNCIDTKIGKPVGKNRRGDKTGK